VMSNNTLLGSHRVYLDSEKEKLLTEIYRSISDDWKVGDKVIIQRREDKP
jgi:hypothetical protein